MQGRKRMQESVDDDNAPARGVPSAEGAAGSRPFRGRPGPLFACGCCGCCDGGCGCGVAQGVAAAAGTGMGVALAAGRGS